MGPPLFLDLFQNGVKIFLSPNQGCIWRTLFVSGAISPPPSPSPFPNICCASHSPSGASVPHIEVCVTACKFATPSFHLASFIQISFPPIPPSIGSHLPNRATFTHILLFLLLPLMPSPSLPPCSILPSIIFPRWPLVTSPHNSSK